MPLAIVTGGTGFVGFNICKMLIANNWQVSAIIRSTSDATRLTELGEIDVFKYDGDLDSIIKYFSVVKADVVFHVASQVVVEHSVEQIDNLVDSNIKFGLHVLEAMKETNTKLIINTGTSWQHFHSTEYNPVNLYAATKQAFEDIIKYYVDAESIRAVTLKLFDTYGENDTRPKLINLINNSSNENITINLSPGKQLLNLVHVDDVAMAYIKAYEHLKNSNDKYKEFGVGTQEIITVRGLVEKFEKETGKKVSVTWGGKEYRKREVMVPWDFYETVPNWKVSVTLEEGLRRLK